MFGATIVDGWANTQELRFIEREDPNGNVLPAYSADNPTDVSVRRKVRILQQRWINIRTPGLKWRSWMSFSKDFGSPPQEVNGATCPQWGRCNAGSEV